MKSIFILFFVVVFSISASAQNIVIPKGEKGYEAAYKRNIKKSRINGVYIPKDLEEAFAELDALSPEAAKAKFKNAPEDIIATKLHFGLGRWISTYWNFTEGSRYVEYLRQLGLTDHDHMIQFTIVSYHKHKNDRPLEIEERVEAYVAERNEFLEAQEARKKVIHTETRPAKKG